MASQNLDGMISIGGRWWCFPSAQIDGDLWEGEWRSDGRFYLHDSVGNVVKGRELSEAESEQMFREGNGSIDLWNENNSTVGLTNEQRDTLARTLVIFAEDLRESLGTLGRRLSSSHTE